MTYGQETAMGELRTRVTGLAQDEPRFTYVGLLMFALIPPTLLAMMFDSRTIDGISIWMKPLKFEVSIGVFLLTLALFARFLPVGMTANRWYRLYALAAVICAVIEMTWIGAASAFGIRSHFNTGPVMSQIYGLMGIVAIFLTSASFVYGVAILWAAKRSSLAKSIGWGCVLTFVLTVPIAGTLASNEGNLVGSPVTNAVVPLLGWSLEVGDLRIAHFFALHAMHFIPIIAFLLLKISESALPNRGVVALSASYAVLTAWTFFVALQGQPII